MSKRKINRVVYRIWHNRSSKGKVGYIGKDSYYPSRTNLRERSKDKKCRKLYLALNKHPINIWIIEILAKGFCTDEALNRSEIFFIKKFNSKKKGYNCTDGGEGNRGLILSEKTKRKISRANIGRKVSKELRLRLSKALKGRKFSNGHKRRISEANKGKKFSVAHRKKLSVIAKNRKFSPQCRRRISMANSGKNNGRYGMPVSKETRLKIGNANRGKKRSIAACKRLSLRLMGNQYTKGYKHTAESKAKMSKANKGKKKSDITRRRMKEAWIKRRKNLRKANGRKEATNNQ